jgi:hypothetical protein
MNKHKNDHWRISDINEYNCPICKEPLIEFDTPDELTERSVCCYCEVLISIKDISTDDDLLWKVCEK